MKQISWVLKHHLSCFFVLDFADSLAKCILNELESADIAEIVHHFYELGGDTDLLAWETVVLAFARLTLVFIFVFKAEPCFANRNTIAAILAHFLDRTVLQLKTAFVPFRLCKWNEFVKKHVLRPSFIFSVVFIRVTAMLSSLVSSIIGVIFCQP